MAALLGEEVKCRVWQSEKPLGEGKVVISEDLLSWKSKDGEFELKYTYPEISIHAISRDFAVFPHECLYVLIIHESEESEEEPSADEEDLDKVEEEGGMNGVEEGGLSSIEVRIVPEDLSKLSEMYSAVSYCQGLHPDPDLSSDSEEDMDHEMMDMLEGGVSEDHPSQEGDEGQYDDAD